MSPRKDSPAEDIFVGDPRFPDRPDSPEFWRLSEIVRRLDEVSMISEASARDFFGQLHQDIGMTDGGQALIYMARGRVKHAVPHNFMSTESRQLLEAIWLDAFVMGALWSKAEPLNPNE